jgi:hypothetical protein
MRRRGWAVLVVAGLGLAACAGPAVETPHVSIIDLANDPAAGIAPVAADRAEVVPAGTLRVTLEELLARHGQTAVEVMRALGSSAPNARLRVDALSANTVDLTRAVGLVYGPVGARAFNQLWAEHTQFLIDYAVARAHSDGAAADEARAHLADYEHDFASMLDTATEGALPADAVRSLLARHVRQMLGQLDRLLAGDAPGSVAVALAGQRYLTEIGNALATGFARQQPVAFPGSTEDDRVAYCSLVGRAISANTLLTATDPALDEGRLAAAAEAALPRALRPLPPSLRATLLAFDASPTRARGTGAAPSAAQAYLDALGRVIDHRATQPPVSIAAEAPANHAGWSLAKALAGVG